MDVSPAPSSPVRAVSIAPSKLWLTGGAVITLTHVDTLLPQSSLPETNKQKTFMSTSSSLYGGALQKIATDKFDLFAIDIGALPVLSPVRILPTPAVSASRSLLRGGALVSESAKLGYESDLFFAASSARASHTLRAPTENLTSTRGASPAVISDTADVGNTLLWLLQPLNFSLFLFADRSDSGDPSAPPSHAQIHSITFASRCTACCTFTTDADWFIATGKSLHASANDTPSAAESRTTLLGPTVPKTPDRHPVVDSSQLASQQRHPPLAVPEDSAFSPATDVHHPPQNGTSTSKDERAPPPSKALPLSELWSVFGFISGDIVVWSHAQRSALKRHNTSRIQVRSFVNASVTALARVDRGSALPSASSSTSTSNNNGNRVTRIFGDLVVGFDNGTVLLVRLNLTGGFVDEDSIAWLGRFSVNGIRPCPIAPHIVTLPCGDGALRFMDLDHYTPRSTRVSTVDVGTSHDERLLAVIPDLSQHGGLLSCDWTSDAAGVVAGGQDDAVTYIGIHLLNVCTSRVNTPDVQREQDRFVALLGSSHNADAVAAHASPSIEVHTVVRRLFHSGWVRSVAVLRIASEATVPPDDFSVISNEGVRLDGVRDTPAPIELSHLCFCASEEGTTSVWHLPNADQLVPPLTGGASPPPPALRALSSTSPTSRKRSFGGPPFPSRPTSALCNLRQSGASFSFASPPPQYQPSSSAAIPGSRWGPGGFGVPAVIGRYPAGILGKLVRAGSLLGRPETAVDDVTVGVTALPLHISGAQTQRDTFVAAITAKGKCVVWSVTSQPQ